MSIETKIQWCDSTVNPIMGCAGCELFTKPAPILRALDTQISKHSKSWKKGRSKDLFKDLIREAYTKLDALRVGHINEVTTTNIHHFKPAFLDSVKAQAGKDARRAAQEAIETNITCYAAMLHLNRCYSILPKKDSVEQRKPKAGYAPTFEQIERFDGRVWDMASERDLRGTKDPAFWKNKKSAKPARTWINGLPRLIFVSDMGDAFSRKEDFEFLKLDVMPAINSEAGRRHLWLWLTKRPQPMKQFASQVGGFPENVCAMTTLTQADQANCNRLEAIKKVQAEVKGLSIEPLWDRIPPEQLPLDGIDWVIIGGESGDSEFVRPFNVQWARELRDHCKKSGVAFFMKQMGKHPVDGDGNEIKLKDSHGGDWDEWEAAGLGDLKVREFPQHFHDYRKEELPTKLKPIRRKEWKASMDIESTSKLSTEERDSFKKLNKTVEKAAKAFVDAGLALMEIRKKKLYREKYATFQDYCLSVHNMSRSYAYFLAKAGTIYHELSTIVDNPDVTLGPIKNEAQLRELARLPDAESRIELLENIEGANPVTASRIRDAVQAKFEAEPKPSRQPSPSARIQNAKATLDELEESLSSGRSAQKELLSLIQELRTTLEG